MKYKTIFAAAAALCVFSMLGACGGNAAGRSADPSGAAASSAEESDEPGMRQIVFRDTIDDPQADYLNSLGGGDTNASGSVTLNLVLSESEPNVFEGCGLMIRDLNIQAEECSSTQEYLYRTGLVQAKPGQDGSLTLTGELIENRTMDAMLPDAPFRLNIHKDGSIRQEKLHFQLTQEGDSASLTIILHEHAQFVFNGELITGNQESPSIGFSNTKSLIYINSLWSNTYSGEEEEYTAILLAEPAADMENYSGQLSVQGTGTVLESHDGTVVFTLESFDDVLYKQSGGELEDHFSQIGNIHTDFGDYLLLLDGNQAVLEPVGKGLCFFGQLCAQSEVELLKNEALQTKRILSNLCRQTAGMDCALPDSEKLQGLDPNDPEDMKILMEMAEQFSAAAGQSQAPAWYPDELIPTVNFSDDDGFSPVSAAEGLFFKIYGTQYCENEDFEAIIEPYRAVLSAYDNYQEYFDNDSKEGVFLFSMGKYSVQIFLWQQVLGQTDVTVQIY